MNYFNPRTREGCDADLDLRRAGNLDFNPRTREGCDRMDDSCPVLKRRDFNPRTREGCDNVIKRLNYTYRAKFQSTHP